MYTGTERRRGDDMTQYEYSTKIKGDAASQRTDPQSVTRPASRTVSHYSSSTITRYIYNHRLSPVAMWAYIQHVQCTFS